MMIELRKGPRVNVGWRAAIKLADGRIVGARVVNLSSGGVLVLCKDDLATGLQFHMMLEVPGIVAAAERHQVPCKGLVLHSILAENEYRIGFKLQELSDLHAQLIQAWLSKVQKG